MQKTVNVVTAPKTGTFQMRINPEVRSTVERIYAESGLSLVDAINLFFQQSINVNGIPFIVTADSEAVLREQAVARLMGELEKGAQSAKGSGGLIDEEDIRREFCQ